jgi:hypothetical protein
MDAILATFRAVGELMKIKFGLRFEEVTGDVLIGVVETTLKSMAQTPGQKAVAQHYVNKFVALSTAVNGLVAIAQPSSEDQARLVKVEAELKALELQLSA